VLKVVEKTVADQVQTKLRDLILSGALVPGAKIDQADLARTFGTSVIPVREALARLQSTGLVRIVPHRGAFVEAVSNEEVIDIYFVREVLEEQAARLAADHLTEADIVTLQNLVNQMEEATKERNHEALFMFNREFHFTIYRAAQRRHLFQIITQLWDQSDRYRRLYTYMPNRASTALAEHKAILAACQQRDKDAMGSTVRYNVHQTTTGLQEEMRTRMQATRTNQNLVIS
jgi:DNA-binding GntR family transcriptional regulator